MNFNELNFNELNLETPNILNNNYYWSKFTNNENLKITFDNTTINKNVELLKRGDSYIYLNYDNENNKNLLLFFKQLQDKIIDLIVLKSHDWFENNVDKNDILNSFISNLKEFNNNFQVKINLISNSTNNSIYINNNNIDLQDFNETFLNKSITPVIFIKGIKFNTKNFYLLLEFENLIIENNEEKIINLHEDNVINDNLETNEEIENIEEVNLDNLNESEININVENIEDDTNKLEENNENNTNKLEENEETKLTESNKLDTTELNTNELESNQENIENIENLENLETSNENLETSNENLETNNEDIETNESNQLELNQDNDNNNENLENLETSDENLELKFKQENFENNENNEEVINLETNNNLEAQDLTNKINFNESKNILKLNENKLLFYKLYVLFAEQIKTHQVDSILGKLEELNINYDNFIEFLNNEQENYIEEQKFKL